MAASDELVDLEFWEEDIGRSEECVRVEGGLETEVVFV